MAAPLLDQRDLEFMLYELFDAESLTSRERYADHNRETFDAAIATSRTVAEKYFLPYRQKVDSHQPTFDGQRVPMIPEIKVALDGTTFDMQVDWFQASAGALNCLFRREPAVFLIG